MRSIDVGTVKGPSEGKKQKVIVFQQQGSGEKKVAGIRRYAEESIDLSIVSIDEPLPTVIEDGSYYLPEKLDADLVLDFLKHPDLSHDLVDLCHRQNIPVISSGKKIPSKWVLTPPTCCGLTRQAGLGEYGERFGAPEYEVDIANGVITDVRVVRGAACAASWEAAKRIIGSPVEDAARKMGIESQFFCSANPAGWDPIHGKSPVHFAGKVHAKAIADAIRRARENED